jgi:hypothetical protein
VYYVSIMLIIKWSDYYRISIDIILCIFNCKIVNGSLCRRLFSFALVNPNILYYFCNVFSNKKKFEKVCTIGVVFGCLLLIFTPAQSDADMPGGALQQRIGNYDVGVKTDPQQPRSGTNVNILLAIASVNGDDISGLPVDITISKDGSVLSKLDRPVAVPYGHYTYHYKFEKPGIYSLDLDIYDIYFTGRQVSFTFPINVQDSLFDFGGGSPMVMSFVIAAIIVIVATSCGFILWHRRVSRLRKPTSQR